MSRFNDIHESPASEWTVRKIGDELSALFGPTSTAPSSRKLIAARKPLCGTSTAYEELVRLSDDLWMMKVHGSGIGERSAIYVGENLFKIHFRMRGSSSIRFPSDDPFDLHGPACGVMLHPEGLEKMEIAHGGEESWITIFCKPAVLSDTLDLPASRLPADFRPFLNGASPALYNRQVPLSPEMAISVASLFREPVDDGVHRVFTEAKVMDLLCQVVMQLTGAPKADATIRLNAREKKRLHEVHETLDAAYVRPPSLSDLARQAGMNQSKLTAAFRQYFGVSIHEYCLARRMAVAMDLLRAGNGTITEVAGAVGYDYPGNFTAAFKRHFGFTPRAVLHRELARR